MFAPTKPFQDGIVFVAKAGAYPGKTPSRCSTVGRLLALATNNSLGWKSLPDLTHKYYTRFQAYLFSDEEKKFLALWTMFDR
jgi:hypothetical protein